MKNLTIFLILLLVMVGCQTQPDDVSIQIPIMMAPSSTLEGNYQIKVSISGADMGTITETVPVSVVIGQAQTQMVTISAVPVGQNRKIKIQILEGDQVVREQSQMVNLENLPSYDLDFVFQPFVEEEVVEEETEKDKPKKITWEKDGKEMVLIPAGSFEMGRHIWDDDAQLHGVELDTFYMDTHEVTVGQFRQFTEQADYDFTLWDVVNKYSPDDDYPMVVVNWNDATAYAKWAGKRLPTEAEWEYAARGGLVGQNYPWGDEITKTDANFWSWIEDQNDQWKYCSPVGSFEANGYGLYDMAGNVHEWCQDWYQHDYYASSPVNNPKGPERPDKNGRRVTRGGSWCNGDEGAISLRVYTRGNYKPSGRYYCNGFRCVSGSN